ncbi:hypothetical protein KFE25_011737 [Diacronema lutheri]|uniref:Uncharacterized protein n=1 Tax=Diacronema lutheri TaxID=2081491 RepID=A0A8J5X860_DIALT|nr:hypothetical protein KFE25_011737 [Diacronema lutheri]
MVLHAINYECAPTPSERHTTRYFLVQIRNLQHVAEGQALLCRLARLYTQLTGRPPRYNVAPLRTHNVRTGAIWNTLTDDERKELRAQLKALDLRDHHGEPIKWGGTNGNTPPMSDVRVRYAVFATRFDISNRVFDCR